MNKFYYNGEEIQPVVIKSEFSDGEIRELKIGKLNKQRGITIRLKNFKFRNAHYRHYMYWVNHCRNCKAHGLNPYSSKTKYFTQKQQVAKFKNELLQLLKLRGKEDD